MKCYKYYVNKCLIALTFLSFTRFQSAKGQKLSKAYVDGFVKNCDNTFDSSKHHLYVINNFPITIEKVDSTLKKWTIDSLGSITFTTANDLWSSSIGRGTDYWVVIISGRYNSNKQIKSSLYKKSKSMLSKNMNLSNYPVLRINDKVYEGINAAVEISKLKLNDIDNIEFHNTRVACLIGFDNKNGLIQVWTRNN